MHNVFNNDVDFNFVAIEKVFNRLFKKMHRLVESAWTVRLCIEMIASLS